MDRKELVSASTMKQRNQDFRGMTWGCRQQLFQSLVLLYALCFARDPPLGHSRKSRCRNHLGKDCLLPSVSEAGRSRTCWNHPAPAALLTSWQSELSCNIRHLVSVPGDKKQVSWKGNSLPQAVFLPVCIYALKTGKLTCN